MAGISRFDINVADEVRDRADDFLDDKNLGGLKVLYIHIQEELKYIDEAIKELEDK